MLPEPVSTPARKSNAALRWHLLIFSALNGVALLASVLVGSSNVWALTLLPTGAALLVHWIAHRVAACDEAWADERANLSLRRGYERGNVIGVLRDFGRIRKVQIKRDGSRVIQDSDT